MSSTVKSVSRAIGAAARSMFGEAQETIIDQSDVGMFDDGEFVEIGNSGVYVLTSTREQPIDLDDCFATALTDTEFGETATFASVNYQASTVTLQEPTFAFNSSEQITRDDLDINREFVFTSRRPKDGDDINPEIFVSLEEQIGEFDVIDAFKVERPKTISLIVKTQTIPHPEIPELEVNPITKMPFIKNQGPYSVVTIFDDGNFFLITSDQNLDTAYDILEKSAGARTSTHVVHPSKNQPTI